MPSSRKKMFEVALWRGRAMGPIAFRRALRPLGGSLDPLGGLLNP